MKKRLTTHKKVFCCRFHITLEWLQIQIPNFQIFVILNLTSNAPVFTEDPDIGTADYSPQMEDTVRSLLRFVARGFYDKAVVLIIDALIVHSVLSEEDLVYLLGMKPKEVRAQCYRLVDDRIILSHFQREESQNRVFNRVYYYIHVTKAIDAIKWKVHFLVHTMKEEMTQYGNPQGYLCPRCGKRVSQLDAISLLSADRTHFECDTCGGTLTEDDSSQQAYMRQARLEKLMVQVDPVIAHLKRIDDMTIQENTFESALTKAVPAQSTATGAYAVARGRKLGPVSASSQKSQATLHVSITANDENLDREQEEREERQKKLEQNALPSWHAASTLEKKPAEDHVDPLPDSNSVSPAENAEPPAEDVKIDTTELKEKEAQDALAAYYAQLAEQEEDDDDDDDEELEDI